MIALYVHLSYNGTIYTLYVTYNATMIIPSYFCTTNRTILPDGISIICNLQVIGLGFMINYWKFINDQSKCLNYFINLT